MLLQARQVCGNMSGVCERTVFVCGVFGRVWYGTMKQLLTLTPLEYTGETVICVGGRVVRCRGPLSMVAASVGVSATHSQSAGGQVRQVDAGD